MHLLLALFLAPAAHAGGYYYADSGIVASGRGNAVVAGADDYFAQLYNPAALMNVDAPTFSLGATSVRQAITFSRLDEDGTFQEPVSNDPAGFYIPELGFAMPLGEKLALAVGSTTPFTPDYLYDSHGPQRYTVSSATLRQAWIGPSLAYQATPWLAVGAGVSWNFLTVNQHLSVTTTGKDEPTNDVGVDVSLKDMDNLHGNIGLLFTPAEGVKVGLSYLPGATFDLTGPMTLDFSEHVFWTAGIIDAETYTDDEVRMQMKLPGIARLGVSVQPIEGLEVEVDGSWEQWSRLEEIVIEGVEITMHTALGDQTAPESFNLPAGFQDAYSLRLGAEYDVAELLSVRGGAMYESPAIQPQYIGVSLVDTGKVKLTGGATLKLLDGHLNLIGAVGYTAFGTQEVRDSVLTQSNAMGDEALTVGNGDYSSHGLTAGLGAAYRF
ncbi:MAG: outer membrane protein transport protein [Deltaproteobacteria bacterium]|nr:outer membrane protein transport protein [Deltaproteobacteria bacterium]